MVWDNGESLDLNLHLSWQGTVVLTPYKRDTGGILAQITLDFKNTQFMKHARVICQPPYIVDLMVNMHVNGETTRDDAEGWDISYHVLLKISDSELQMLRIWVPSQLDAILARPEKGNRFSSSHFHRLQSNPSSPLS
ncbi:MAG: hypothetical protein ABSB83_07040 [Methanomassiliicoccales archaeon]|jgi:hypothetical protein